jgi:hypothetical protein
MPRIMELVLRFQLTHPSATREDVEAYMSSEESRVKVEGLVEEMRPKAGAKGKGAQKGVKRAAPGQ